MTPIACVDVMRRTLAPAICRVVSETSALRGNLVEIASVAVTGVTRGVQGSSARCPAATRPGACGQGKAGRNPDVFVPAPLMFAYGALLTETHALLLEIAAADKKGIAVPCMFRPGQRATKSDHG